jgi:Mlc titration factor MtfA (ptsG expression regulator)
VRIGKQLFIALIKLLIRWFIELYYQLFVQARLEFILRKNSAYYQNLQSEKAVFKRKVWDFLLRIKVVSREELKIKGSFRVTMAAHAIQLSRNLSPDCYTFYKRIILYKDHYLSKVTGKYHKGEVNPGLRTIVFSMKAIHESLRRSEPGKNILVHEFAHALWLEHLLMHNEYSVFNATHFEHIRSLIAAELQAATTNHNHFLRGYAFSNEAEYFAVASENFFERPGEFKSKMPLLYEGMSKLFAQDPFHLR